MSDDLFLLQGQPGGTGPIGVQGNQGPNGPQGSAGTAGGTGAGGAAGGTGPIGPTGPTGSTGTTGATGTMLPVAYADTSLSPTVLHQFNGSLVDASGNSHTLTATATARYTDIYPTVRGLAMLGDYGTRNSDAALRSSLGDLTVEVLCYLHFVDNMILAEQSWGGSDAAENQNYTWRFSVIAGGTLNYFAEFGVGANISYSVNIQAPIRSLCHLLMTRASDVIKFYLNGAQCGPTSSTQTTPTGGSISTYQVGNDFGVDGTTPSGIVSGSLASVGVYLGTALSASQVKARYNATMGKRFPNRP